MDSSTSQHHVSPERPRKRQRVSRACDPCRNRKTACDGRRPVCMACESRAAALNCRYEFVPKRESEKWDAVGDGISSRRSTFEEVRVERPRNSGLNSFAGARDSRAGETPLEEAFSSAPSDGLATFPGNADQAAYGPSSTVAFLRHIIARGSRPGSVTPSDLHSPSKPSASKRVYKKSEQPGPIQHLESSQAVLPLRRNADDFLLCYWEFIHPVFPLLHRTTFVDQYERLWMSNKSDTAQASDIQEPFFMSLLYLAFALGCKLSKLVLSTQKSSTADDFYQKSRMLSEYLILDSTSVTTVQLLALSGVYLQSTQYASRCWNSVGLAIRAAQSLGLHAELNGQKAGSQLELEMQRRIWHVCVSLDRLLSMTFGRPAMIAKSNDVPLPTMIDDEYLSTTDEGQQPPHTPSRLGAFVFSCKLFDLLGQVLNFLSAPTLQHTAQKDISQISEVLSQVLDLNRKLDNFSENVPPYLRKTEVTSPFTASSESHTQLQQRVLHCRLMLVRLLLLRPLLLMSTRIQRPSTIQALDGTWQSSLDAELVKNCCNLCLRTAYRLIDAIYYNLNTLYRSSGWHAVYFAFSASIVLVASLRCPLIEVTISDSKFESGWTRCMAIFEHYRDQIHSAAHAIFVLRAIKDQIARTNDIAETSTNDQPELSNTVPKTPAAPVQQDMPWPELNFDGLDPFGFDNISDAWFGQQIINLDWLELPEL